MASLRVPFLQPASQTIEKEAENNATMASSSTIPEEGSELIQNGVNLFDLLPEGFTETIISFTTPADACRLALVSKDMLSASESNVVWKRFLPSDIDLILSKSDEGKALLTNSQSKKQLCKSIFSTQPLLVDQCSKSFWLERSSGKKCWMISARSLNIAWGETPMYWRWIFNPMYTRGWFSIARSRFREAAELVVVSWFDVGARIKTAMLSRTTQYGAYLVFFLKRDCRGFDNAFEASVGRGGVKTTESVYIDISWGGPKREADRTPVMRGDGWLEVLIGEFFSDDPEEGDGEVELSVREVSESFGKSGIIVEGIELRPSLTA